MTSLSMKQAVNAQETSEAFLILITIDHDDLATPIRVTSDAVDTTSRSNLFIAFPFDIILPADDGETPPAARLTIDNVSREIGQAIRSISTPPSVTIEIVLSSDVDTVEASFPYFELTDVQYDDLTVSGALTIQNLSSEPYPAESFIPSTHPGLF
jgi:hypothetical protein